MTQYRYEYGKRWDARVPRYAISHKLGKLHVGTPDAAIEALIREACKAPGFTPSLIRQSVAYALECHKRNRDLYQYVTGGSIR